MGGSGVTMLMAGACTLFGYGMGGLLFSYFLPRALQGVDVRTYDADGNPGAANAWRACGPAIGLLCGALDVLKAYLPVSFAFQLLGLDRYWLIPVVVAPVVGHAFSPFMRFRGGKAIAATFGALLGICPQYPIVLVLAACLLLLLPMLKSHTLLMVVSALLFALLVPLFVPLLPFLWWIAWLLSALQCLKHYSELKLLEPPYFRSWNRPGRGGDA